MAQKVSRKSVRVLLAVGAPIVVAVVGVCLGITAGPAQADNGQSVILGVTCFNPGTNCETSGTAVYNTGSGPAFDARAYHGEAGLVGENYSNPRKVGGIAAGVWGAGSGPGAIGVFGDGGQSGVLGESDGGTGVDALSLRGIALKVEGRVQLSLSGVATVAGTAASPKNSVRVRLPETTVRTYPITAKSMMTALLQKYVPGVNVVAAVPSVRGHYFTIYLNKAVTASVGPIAWMVTERP